MKRRSIVSLVAIVAVLTVAWIGGWFWLASFAEQRADAALREMAARGVDVACAERTIGGFPFAIELRCGPTSVVERSGDTRLQAPSARARVSVFSPLTAEVAMTAPVDIQSPALDGPSQLRFDRAVAQTGLGMNGPRDYAFEASNLVAEFTPAGRPAGAVSASAAEGSLTPSASAGSDIAITFSDLVASIGETRYPAFSGSLVGELSIPPRALLSGEAGGLAPISARAVTIQLDSGGARLDIDGDAAIDAEGVIDGALVIRVAGADRLPTFIEALPPHWRNLGNAVAAGVIAFGQPTTIDGAAATELKIQIVRGETNIGPLPVTLPRIAF